MNPGRRKLLKLRARQAKVVTPVAPVVPAKRRTKKSTQVPETVTEKEEAPVAVEEPKPKSTRRKRSWKL
tara:strand:- start:169 stop:375 length:207 start_codon:yes stop_codon:yes gene_type:complete